MKPLNTLIIKIMCVYIYIYLKKRADIEAYQVKLECLALMPRWADLAVIGTDNFIYTQKT